MEVWYCPNCGEEAQEKVMVRHNGFVPVYYCRSCADEYFEKMRRAE